jgi:hypothetical protein
MAVVASTPTTVSGMFKKVYANTVEVLPDDFELDMIAKFEQGKKVGQSIAYSIPLTHENGLSLFGSSGDVQSFADAQAGVVREATLVPCETFISSALSTATLSRAATEGERAFKVASKDRVIRNIKSHRRFLKHMCLYGRDTFGLGRVGYFTATWQGTAFTNGTGTLGGVAFTNGVNTGAKKILLNPADLATGIWMGAEGMEIRQRVIGGAVAATGVVTAVDLKNGIVTVDFTPVVATAASSHCLELLNQNGASGLDFAGAKVILQTTGSLFGIDNSVYGIWKGSEDVITGKLTFPKLINSLMIPCNRGLDSDVSVFVSYDTWTTLMTEQSALRQYDDSYKSESAEQGFRGIRFNSINGSIEVVPSRFVRRSDAFVLSKSDWRRIGSSEITMKIPGVDDGDLIQKPISTNAFVFRSYSDQALICLAPSQSLYLSGIDPLSGS